jgi:hypothetical protein
MTENIAQEVREEHPVPDREFSRLHAQAQRLRRSLAVTDKWIEAAFTGETSELLNKAEYMRDKLDEELAKVAFEMELLARRREYREHGIADEDASDEALRSDVLSGALLEAYSILRDAPDEHFGYGDAGPARTRYGLMGALMEAQGVQGKG